MPKENEGARNGLVDDQQHETIQNTNNTPKIKESITRNSVELSADIDEEIAAFIGPENMGNLVVGLCIPSFPSFEPQSPNNFLTSRYQVKLINETGDSLGPMFPFPKNMPYNKGSENIEQFKIDSRPRVGELWDNFPAIQGGTNHDFKDDELKNINTIQMNKMSEPTGDDLYDCGFQRIGWKVENGEEAFVAQYGLKEVSLKEETDSASFSDYASEDELLLEMTKKKRRKCGCCVVL